MPRYPLLLTLIFGNIERSASVKTKVVHVLPVLCMLSFLPTLLVGKVNVDACFATYNWSRWNVDLLLLWVLLF